MSSVERYEIKSYLENKYGCHLTIKDDYLFKEMSILTLGFKKHNENNNLFIADQEGYKLVILKKGDSYRLLNKKIMDKSIDVENILHDLLINDNQVIFNITNIEKIKEYIKQL